MSEQLIGHRLVAIDVFAMQVLIAEQPVDRLDVVFDEGIAFAVPPEMCESEHATVERCSDDTKRCVEPRLMADDLVALAPSFQLADRVHAVLSDAGDCVATTIG